MTSRRLLGPIFAFALVLSACGGDDDVSPVVAEVQEEIDMLLETEEGRGQLAVTLATGSPMTFEQSECFIENSSSRDLAGLIALGSGEAGTNIPGVLEPIREAMEACGVQLDSFNVQ